MLTTLLTVLSILFFSRSGTDAHALPERGAIPADRPNILWLTFEDTSPEFVGCYGNKAAQTPVMDQLAAEGTRFSRAFSTGSVCSPSRNALILGCKTSTLGTGNHRSDYSIPGVITGFPNYLRDAGYYTSNNSKTDYNTSAAQRLTRESWDESSPQAGWWKRQAGQPFFAVFNSISSHQSRTMTSSFESYRKQVLNQLAENARTRDNDVVMPPFYRDTPDMRKQVARIYNSITKTDTEFGEILARLDREGLRQNTIIFLFADHGEGMPGAKTNGKGIGHRVPFIVWFPDRYKHLSPWKQGGVVTDEMIDFVDLAPTLLTLAGVAIPTHMQGRSLMGSTRRPAPAYLFLSSDRSDESYDLTRTVIKGRYAYTRVFMPHIPELRYLQYMDVGEITKQIRQDFRANQLNSVQMQMLRPRPTELLYDLENDPWEVDNLATKKGHEKLLNEFRTALRNHVLHERDVHFLPEYELASLPGTTTAYDYRQQNANFPIRDIYAAALLSGYRNSRVARKQIALLANSNAVVRYWALMGLKSQSKALLIPYQARLAQILTDTYPLNQILAASLLNEHFGDETARRVLEKQLNAPEDHIANVVLQNLLYQSNAAVWLPVVETMQQDKKEERFNTARSVAVFLYVHGGRPLRNEAN